MYSWPSNQSESDTSQVPVKAARGSVGVVVCPPEGVDGSSSSFLQAVKAKMATKVARRVRFRCFMGLGWVAVYDMNGRLMVKDRMPNRSHYSSGGHNRTVFTIRSISPEATKVLKYAVEISYQRYK